AAACRPRLMIYDPEFAAHVAAARAAAPELGMVFSTEESLSGLGSYENLLAGADSSAAANEADVVGDDPLWYFFTSGTTGRPKAAVLTHGQMGFVVTNHLADLLPGLTEEDCSLVVAPLSHGAGIHALTQVARGACSVLPSTERLDPEEVWQL